MLNVGLTGGIASGKSTIARMLAAKGADLIDFDVLAHEVQAPEGPVWREIVRHFGTGILRTDQTIDRAALGRIVFADPAKRELLNGLVHPAVREAWRERIAAIVRGRPEAIVLSDVPLLIEQGMEPLFDLVVLVYAPPERQLERLIARNGYSRREAAQRLSSQLPIDRKLERADLVIRNEGSLKQTRQAVDALWEELRQREMCRRTGAGAAGAGSSRAANAAGTGQKEGRG
jgi:dephospho-CoA kinase